MPKKYISKGKVAVLVSHGYGAGWSTWNPEVEEEMIFSPEIVELILAKMDQEEIYDKARELWPNAYLGGICGLTVEWIEKGKEFLIYEYDGSESILILEGKDYHTA